MSILSSALDLVVAHWRKLSMSNCLSVNLTNYSANLARAGHSVLLLEAGGDAGETLLQEVPAWFVHLPHPIQETGQIDQRLYIGLLKLLKRLTCLGAFSSIITRTNRRLSGITNTPIG